MQLAVHSLPSYGDPVANPIYTQNKHCGLAVQEAVSLNWAPGEQNTKLGGGTVGTVGLQPLLHVIDFVDDMNSSTRKLMRRLVVLLLC